MKLFRGLSASLLAAALLAAAPMEAFAATPVQGQINGGSYVTLKVNKNGELVGAFVADGSNDLTGSISLTDNTPTAILAAQGAGIRGCLVWLDLSGVAATTAVTIAIKDGSTTKFTFNIPAAASSRHIPLERPLCSTANTAINGVLSGSPTGAVQVNGGGYKVPN